MIYFLADTHHNPPLFYVGETKQSLVERWGQEYPEIPDWNFYKYIELPNSVDKQTRVMIQDMLIHAFASVLEEKKKPEKVKTLDSHLSKNSGSFSNYKLANLDIKK